MNPSFQRGSFAMVLTDTQKQEFKDKGFIVVPGYFNRQQMARISNWLHELKNKNPKPGEEAKYFEQSSITGENVIVRIENILGPHNPQMTEIFLSDKTIGCLTDLLDEQPVLFKEKVNYKIPGCRADKLHQDQAAGWNAYGDFYITMGIMADPNRKENAALSFMKSGNYPRGLMTPEWQPITEDDPPYQPEDEYMLLEGNPGDVIFFDSYVPHGSPPNTSDETRRNIFLTFNGQSQGDKRAQYYADKWAAYPPNQEEEARAGDTFRV